MKWSRLESLINGASRWDKPFYDTIRCIIDRLDNPSSFVMQTIKFVNLQYSDKRLANLTCDLFDNNIGSKIRNKLCLTYDLGLIRPWSYGNSLLNSFTRILNAVSLMWLFEYHPKLSINEKIARTKKGNKIEIYTALHVAAYYHPQVCF